MKTKRQENCGIATLKNPQDGHTVTDPLKKANILNQHFRSVFATDDNATIPDNGPSLFPDKKMTKNPQYYIIDWIIQMWITLIIHWPSVEVQYFSSF